MEPRLYDTHAHVQFNAFKDDGHEVIRRALDAGVWMNVVGSQIDTSKRAIEYAEQYPEGVYALIALHPIHLFSTYVDEDEIQFTPLEAGRPEAAVAVPSAGRLLTGFKSREEKFDPDIYRELAKSKKVVGIGECGLDYYRIEGVGQPIDVIKQKQKEVFRQHIELALELNLPMEIHCRDGSTSSPQDGSTPLATSVYDDIYAIVQAYPQLRAIMHCYLGTAEQAKKFLALGFLISFSGIVTFKNAKALQEVARMVPLDRMVVETDCPYLAPEPYRGKRNEPAYVEHVSRKIAELKGISFDEVSCAITANARNFFGGVTPSFSPLCLP